MQRRDINLGIAAVLVASVCVGLGIWQLKRLGQRRARNAVIAARWALPPLELRNGTVPVDSIRQRRVIARGIFAFSAEQT